LDGPLNIGGEAYGVSGDGSVVVGRSGFPRNVIGGVRTEAFRWTPGGGMESLGTLPGGVETAANDVSDDGSVVVGWNNASATTIDSEAFRWTSAGGMVGLGHLPGGGSSYADAVSADGSVVVGFSDGPSFLDEGFRAFYWTANGGMRALWDVLHAHGVDPATDGWSELSHAVDISADGNTIVGYGIRNDNHEAFVAVIPKIVPEPSAGALALLGLSSILLLRRRRARGRAQCVPAVLVAAASLAALTAASTAAIDTEALNNSQLTADSLPTLLPGTAISNLARLDGAGGDVDFFQTPLDAGEVLFGMVTPLAGLPANFQSPDTMVSVFDDSQTRTFSENDFASELPDFGEGRGSLFRFESPATAVYRIGVSGCCDFAFDSDASGFSHNESGG
jgi:probable HAF family extracellular repeat protein